MNDKINEDELFKALDRIPAVVESNKALTKACGDMLATFAKHMRDVPLNHKEDLREIRNTVKNSVVDTVNATLEGKIIRDANANPQNRKRGVNGCTIGLVLFLILPLLIYIFIGCRESARRWGRINSEIYCSKVITKTERTELSQDTTPTAILPNEFHDNRKEAIAKIRRNRRIVRERERMLKRTGKLVIDEQITR